ncbi:MAG TPA: hypothetical protein VNN76_04175 [Bacteroidota bacterium]|nr:hypothetical protein [Bacteroidota bacterium]
MSKQNLARLQKLAELEPELEDALEEIARNNGYLSIGEYLRSIALKKGFATSQELLDAALFGFDPNKYSESRILKEVEARLLSVPSPIVKKKPRLPGPRVKPRLNAKNSPLKRLKVTTYEDLSRVIKKRLKAIRANQSWLAREMRVSREAVSQYVRGKTFPKRKRILQSLESVLNVRVTRRDRTENESHDHLEPISVRPHEVAEVLEKRLKELGKDLLWLGRQLRVSQRTIEQYFKHEMAPRSKEVLSRLEKVLNIEVKKKEKDKK